MDHPSSADRRRFLKAAAGLTAAGAVIAAGGWTYFNRGRSLFEVRRERSLMQTSVSISALAPDVEAARGAIEQAFARMAAAAAILTRFDAASPVARLNREGRLADPPAMLQAVLARAQAVARDTGGAFDVTVCPVLDYLLGLQRPVTLDTAKRGIIESRDREVDYRHLQLGSGGVQFLRPGMAITLDGIAKGYIVDQGIAALRQAGIEDAVIDAGGEVRTIAGADPGRYWNVGIADPQDGRRVAAVVRLRNAALSTSGNYEVFFSADRRLFHIIDPHTGYSPDRYSSVTVMAPESVDSDAMSVAAFSLPLEQLKPVMAAGNLQWLAFSWDGARRWRSADLPLVSGAASIA